MSDLHKARRNKKDEFYTQFEDIQKELSHYRKHFEGKIVYCNCDDPYISNFFDYFAKSFESLKLKKLISTSFQNEQPNLFSQHIDGRGLKIVYEGDKDGDGLPSIKETKITKLKGDGDFRSEECIEFLQEADIVCTNPPFSLFREYLNQLMQYQKKFLIIGNIMQSGSKEIFPFFFENKIWMGPSISGGDREFGVPDYYQLKASGFRIDDDGRKFIRVKGVRWFTNLSHDKQNQKIELIKNYSPEKYPHYDNYDAIEVGEVADIPQNWGGANGRSYYIFR
ncbi:MAG: adenosine deaminase [Flavobacteriaceae bacterium]|nr:adenosine deaminase [Flavobacteriaceae bacterium]MCY4298692.1 adenosine deaminase [Flavobacteriaceae bacterium]